MIISFDINTFIYIIILIPVATYLIRIAYWCAEATLSYIRNHFNKRMVNENKRVVRENIKATNELISIQRDLRRELELTKMELEK